MPENDARSVPITESSRAHSEPRFPPPSSPPDSAKTGYATDDDVELNVLGCRVDILGTNCDQCVSMVLCCFRSTETIRLIRTGSPGRPSELCYATDSKEHSISVHLSTYAVRTLRNVWALIPGSNVICEPVWPSGKQKGLGSTPLRLSFLFRKVVVCGHCLVTLSLTINETLKWLS